MIAHLVGHILQTHIRLQHQLLRHVNPHFRQIVDGRFAVCFFEQAYIVFGTNLSHPCELFNRHTLPIMSFHVTLGAVHSGTRIGFGLLTDVCHHPVNEF
ncbi:hypothetical protein D3C85_1337600 [compost metagenome]